MAITQLATVYATDEDIAVRASADFRLLVPKDQKYAAGTDGSFPAVSGGSWVMTSATQAFATLGVEAGMVAQLTLAGVIELFAIDSVSGSTITLRRRGLDTGVGLPPGAAAGSSGITFAIQTFYPQIEAASYDINKQFGIVTTGSGRRPSDLFDARELRDACVLLTLSRVYLLQARSAGERTDDFASKAKLFEQEYRDALAKLVVHWNAVTSTGSTPEVTSRFSTRLSR